MRAFLDTSLLVNAFTTRGLGADVLRRVMSEHELLTGEVNLAELQRALRDRIKLPARTIREIVHLLHEHEIIPRPEHQTDIEIPDPDDRCVLASAISGNADVLITGDKTLLDLSTNSPLLILDPRGFWDLVRQSS